MQSSTDFVRQNDVNLGESFALWRNDTGRLRSPGSWSTLLSWPSSWSCCLASHSRPCSHYSSARWESSPTRSTCSTRFGFVAWYAAAELVAATVRVNSCVVHRQTRFAFDLVDRVELTEQAALARITKRVLAIKLKLW